MKVASLESALGTTIVALEERQLHLRCYMGRRWRYSTLRNSWYSRMEIELLQKSMSITCDKLDVLFSYAHLSLVGVVILPGRIRLTTLQSQGIRINIHGCMSFYMAKSNR